MNAGRALGARGPHTLPLPVVTIACGCAALALRPVGAVAAVAVTVAVGMIGLLVPAPRPADALTGKRQAGVRWVVAMAVGLAAFTMGQTLSHPDPTPLWLPAVLASGVAAIAEEGFFRRLVYDELARWGPAAAIVGAAVLFALVHAPAYGVGTMMINLAAGLLFGWQRWATGGWSAPALTHLTANLLHYTNLLSVG